MGTKPVGLRKNERKEIKELRNGVLARRRCESRKELLFIIFSLVLG